MARRNSARLFFGKGDTDDGVIKHKKYFSFLRVSAILSAETPGRRSNESEFMKDLFLRNGDKSLFLRRTTCVRHFPPLCGTFLSSIHGLLWLFQEEQTAPTFFMPPENVDAN